MACSERASTPSTHQQTGQNIKEEQFFVSCCCSLLLHTGEAKAIITMENKSPSSCVSPAATSTMSAGESSWAMHIANFLASSPQDREMGQQAVSAGGSFSSSFDDASFITSELMCNDDDEEDESLQDTACSSAAGEKIASMEHFDLKSMATMDAKEFNMPQLAKYLEAVGSKHQVTAVDQQAMINSFTNNNEKALYESNELRKKGLCLVPISMLINYLG